MHIFNLSLVLLTLMSLVSPGTAKAASTSAEVGGAAPDFILHGTDGALYRLSEHVGKRGVVIAWFPKAFTPG